MQKEFLLIIVSSRASLLTLPAVVQLLDSASDCYSPVGSALFWADYTEFVELSLAEETTEEVALC
jgi:hypothetical protein